MDVSAIISQFGLEYRDNGQSLKDLKVELYAQTQTDKYFTKLVSKDTVKNDIYVTTDRVTQAFQQDFTALGSATYTPNEIKAHHIMIDYRENPDAADETYLGFIEEAPLDRSKWSYIKWKIQNEIVPQHLEDLETLEAFDGDRLASGPIVPETPSPAGESLDGINTLRKAGIAASGPNKITPISTGVFETDPELFVDQLNDFVQAIDPQLRRRLTSLQVSTTARNLFREGMRLKYNTHYKDADPARFYNYPTIMLEGLDNMEGHDVIWGSPKKNSIVLYKKSEHGKVFRVYPDDRYVKFTTDYYKGYGWSILPWVVTNDQETV